MSVVHSSLDPEDKDVFSALIRVILSLTDWKLPGGVIKTTLSVIHMSIL